jgi:beta-galactosidase
MTEESFNAQWRVRPKTSIFTQLRAGRGGETPVTLPHDAVIHAERSSDESGSQAFFPGGTFEYLKSFDAPTEWKEKRVSLHFHGAYRDAMVFVNDGFAGHRPSGYSEFFIDLDPFLYYGGTNTIRVETRARDDSRWYTGSGLYRGVGLIVAEPVHILPRGITVTTPDVDAERAVVEVAVTVRNTTAGTRTRTVAVGLDAPDGTTVAHSSAPVTVRPGCTATARLRLYVDAPLRWSVETPYLYEARTRLLEDGRPSEEHLTMTGIRTLQLDPKHGLRINGKSVKLRGTCLHHDNGILGAASFARAEERKVAQLKEAGFTAVRAAHSPFAESFLDACDRLGMLVIDEAFDVWADSKSALDSSLTFPEWWSRDLEAMVATDRNHPSVIMYSIGNEILEVGTPHGAAIGRDLAERIRELDPTRFVTNGINALVAVMPTVLEKRQQASTINGGVNAAMAAGPAILDDLVTSELVSDATEESFAVLDVAGWNYADARYERDFKAFPDRIVVGTETFPRKIADNWALVTAHPRLIGDFTWTGYDYLGEVGIGRAQYTDTPSSFEAPYPWIAAWCGDLDLLGRRRPASYYREIVFGLRTTPYLAVQRPETFQRETVLGRWAWSDSIASWTWDVAPGTPIRVEVYAPAEVDEVELLLNGETISRVQPGADLPLITAFELTYQPGELTTVTYREGSETGRTSLVTAKGSPRLVATLDRAAVVADHEDLAFIDIELCDEDGVLHTAADQIIEVHVEGAGVLAALGSARPETLERYDDGSHLSFDGRALAVVRPTMEGEILVTISGSGLAELRLIVAAGAQG